MPPAKTRQSFKIRSSMREDGIWMELDVFGGIL